MSIPAAALHAHHGRFAVRAHHLGRILPTQGHEVRLTSPEHVRPYVKSQKNDNRDAEAIAEAATRPTMRFVELKSEEQFDMRSRDRLLGERTALINQLQAILLERGITGTQGRRQFERHLAGLNSTGGLSQRMRVLIEDMQQLQWRELNRRSCAAWWHAHRTAFRSRQQKAVDDIRRAESQDSQGSQVASVCKAKPRNWVRGFRFRPGDFRGELGKQRPPA